MESSFRQQTFYECPVDKAQRTIGSSDAEMLLCTIVSLRGIHTEFERECGASFDPLLKGKIAEPVQE
jgi:hypothetical protein